MVHSSHDKSLINLLNFLTQKCYVVWTIDMSLDILNIAVLFR